MSDEGCGTPVFGSDPRPDGWVVLSGFLQVLKGGQLVDVIDSNSEVFNGKLDFCSANCLVSLLNQKAAPPTTSPGLE